VLVNVLGKSPKELFEEFEGKHEWKRGVTGDVKYHSGYSADVQTKGGTVHLALGFNPSHLEIVNPVILGSARSRQDKRGDRERRRVMGILIHGDSAIAGQGVVYETFQLAETRGYGTGGTIHIVSNNRIGFTTSHPKDVRSALYCTDVGKVVQAPIFHVNGDDPEAVAFIMQMAVNWRMTFKRDVVIDIVCYRRHGHNEADEPAATQPMMYKKIRAQKTTRTLFAEKLVSEGVVTQQQADDMIVEYRRKLEADEQVALGALKTKKKRNEWNKYAEAKWTDRVETAMPVQEIKRIGTLLATPPENVQLHERVMKIMDDRVKMAAGALPVDWGFAEIMAYAGLLKEGFGVRISGQDSGRGTFFHRHAVMHNMRDGDEYIPLQHLFDGQPQFEVIDSILSEEAVLGFEYGYNAADPKSLVIWEAQFGDFANGAQVVIDQFIAAAEQKWNLLTPLTLMLPHGWEGQGPEHTSARLERFLQLCAQENMQVCYPTTPAQMFHLLRRQMIRNYRKPLIIMTPKSPLRRKITFSTLEDLSIGTFQNVIGEIDRLKPDSVKRVVICSGKIYWDLLEARRERGIGNVALLRLEQIYPFPQDELTAQIGQYVNAPEVCWCQEEPQNQGAWYTIQSALRTCMSAGQSLVYAGRVAMAAPAGGDHHKHLERQKKVVDDALTLRAAARHDAAAAGQRPQLV
jgi:2-oxoglutarate dehydrogenase E1 component